MVDNTKDVTGFIRDGLCSFKVRFSERGRYMSDMTQEKLALMRYVELLEAEALVVSKPDTLYDQRIEFATDDSRQVRPGTLFVCKGRAFKREYLVSAIADGAVAYVSEVDYDVDIPAVIVNDIRRTLAVVADAYYCHPSGKVKVCAFMPVRYQGQVDLQLLSARHSCQRGKAHGLPSACPQHGYRVR